MIAKLFILLLLAGTIYGKTLIVAETGGDYTKIQDAINVAVAGDTILVREKSTPYFEEITFKSSGNDTDGYIVLAAHPNEKPIIDGTNFIGGDNWPQGLVRIINVDYVKVIGFEIRNLITSNSDWFPAGIWVRGNSHHIEIVKNSIHHIEHNNADGGAHGIAVYGTSSSASINNILIDGNEIYNCKLAWSESLVLNGNVENFIVSNNIVHDNNNIAFDFIGHEGECPDPALDQARNGLVKDNIAYNIDSRTNPSYEGEGSADGFYVDGGKDIIFERNLVYNCNIGFEVASEHGGKSTSGIIVRNNFIKNNISLGLAIGGYDSQRGSANNCKIINNTFYKNNTENFSWGAEILVQYYCEDNLFANNIIYSKTNVPMVDHITNTGSSNTFDNNLYFSEGNSLWKWGANSYSNFENYKTGVAQESNSLFANPLLVNPSGNNPDIEVNSSAVDMGIIIEQTQNGEYDFFGNSRIVNNKIDIGAVESQVVSSIKGLGEVVPEDFYLYPSYPNPFNQGTTIKFRLLPNIKETITLVIYDSLGKRVHSKVFKNNSGNDVNYHWNASENSSGIYYAVVSSSNEFQTNKLMLIK